MKTYGGEEVQLHAFLTLATDVAKWSPPCTGRYIPGERSRGINWIGGLVGPRTDLNDVQDRKELLPPRRESNPEA
jgi:hypothetical protein